MYAWLWNHLPGPFVARAAICLVALVGIVTALFLWVFPWMEPRLPFTDVTVDETSARTTALSPGLSTAGEITRMGFGSGA